MKQGALRAIIQWGNFFQHLAGETRIHRSTFISPTVGYCSFTTLLRQRIAIFDRQCSTYTAAARQSGFYTTEFPSSHPRAALECSVFKQRGTASGAAVTLSRRLIRMVWVHQQPACFALNQLVSSRRQRPCTGREFLTGRRRDHGAFNKVYRVGEQNQVVEGISGAVQLIVNHRQCTDACFWRWGTFFPTWIHANSQTNTAGIVL